MDLALALDDFCTALSGLANLKKLALKADCACVIMGQHLQ
jgi:EAL domain-containing protein (putative c-di-GMP-specific phosphodiesterase class I)